MMVIEADLTQLDLVAKAIPNEGVVILMGDLASGKTTLTKAVAKTMGVKQDVTSPTFSIMQSYEGKNGTLYHYDIYQNGFKNMVENGVFENLLEDGLHIVEWGDDELIKALKIYKVPITVVKITLLNDKRRYEIYEA